MIDRFLLFFRHTGYLFYKATKKYFDDRCPIHAQALAFKTMLALFPLAFIFFGILSVFPVFADYKKMVLKNLTDLLIPEIISIIRDWFEIVINNPQRMNFVNILTFILLSLDLFINLDNEVNRIWSSRIKRTLIQKITIYWVLITVTPLLFVGYFYNFGQIKTFIGPIQSFQNMENYFSIFLLFLFFFILCIVVPNVKVHVVKAFVVSVVLSILWNILKFLFTFYTKVAIENLKIYGLAAAFFFMMIWLTLNWFLFFYFLEILIVWQEKLYITVPRIKKAFIIDVAFVILVLRKLYRDFQDSGDGLTLDELAIQLKSNKRDLAELMKVLEEEGFIVAAGESVRYYYIKKNFNKLTLTDIEKIIWKRISEDAYLTNEELHSISNKLAGYYLAHDNDEEINLNKVLFS